MNSVTIHTKAFFADTGEWVVSCSVDTQTGSRIGSETVYGPESMTDEELKGAILAKYL